MKLHLGCGSKYIDGWMNVDMRKDIKTDKVLDFDKIPLPFKTDSFDEIKAEHVFEHLKCMLLEPIKYMEEIYRISKNNAIITIEVPFGLCIGQLDHKRGYLYTEFDLLSDNNPDRHTDSPARFKISYETVPTKIGKFIPNFNIPGSNYGLRDSIALIINQINKNIIFTLQVVK